eukprot:gene905-9815_t
MSLKELLQKSQQLGETDSFVHKNLESVHEQTKKLSKKILQTTDQSKADRLLSRRGFDVEKYRRGPSKMDLKTSFEPQEPRSETDIEGTLKHEIDMIMITAIEETKKHTSEESFRNFIVSSDRDWENAKKDFRQKVDLHLYSIGETSTLSTSVIMDNSRINESFETIGFTPGKRGKSSLDFKMTGYSSVIYQFNKKRRTDDEFPIFEKLQESFNQSESSLAKSFEMNEIFRMIKKIVDEPENIKNGKKTPTPSLMNKNAIQYLQEQYQKHLRDVVEQNTSAKKLSKKDLIRSYLEIRFKKPTWPKQFTIVSNYPIWGMIYYALRCGFMDLALDISKSNAVSEVFQTALELLSQERDLPNDLRTQISSEYKSSKNLFQQTVFLIVGKCDPSKVIKQVTDKTEDWIWFKLSTIQEKEGNTLQSVQKIITESGPDHFCPQGKHILLYFKLLILTQQFEEAIAYLCSFETYVAESIHFAIGFNYYKILKKNDKIQSKILEDGKINFNFLIKCYVRQFAHTNLRETVSYFYLIEEKKIRNQFIKDLILESKDISTLLGYINLQNGIRKPGCLEEFFEKDDLINILKLTCDEYEKNGRYDTAIHLNFLLEYFSDSTQSDSNYYLQNILSIINKELSEVLLGGRNRKEIIQLAQEINKQFGGKLERKLSSFEKYETFHLLFKLIQYFDLYLGNKYSDCLNSMENIALIPMNEDERDEKIDKYKRVDKLIQSKYSEIIYTLMDCLFQLYSKDTENNYEFYRERANCLLSFAGNITDMSNEIYQQLMKLEGKMKY